MTAFGYIFNLIVGIISIIFMVGANCVTPVLLGMFIYRLVKNEPLKPIVGYYLIYLVSAYFINLLWAVPLFPFW